MHNEVRASKAELQILQASKMALEVSVEKNERDAQNNLAELQRLQQEYQVLKTEKDDLKKSYETLSAEKDQLQSKVQELEAQRVTMEEKEKQFQVQEASFKGQIASLTTSLKDASEQKTNIQPVKKHVLAQRRIIHQLQMCIKEERCKILQIDSRLEEILDTTSYFVDRSQDILEVLAGRILWIEANEETPA